MAGKERKADEEKKQIGDQHPFMGKMGKEAGEPGALVEAVPNQLLHDDGAKTGERCRERMAMKNRNASERDAEQEKIERHGRIVSAERRCDGHAQALPLERTRSLHIREMPSAGNRDDPGAKAGLSTSFRGPGSTRWGKLGARESPVFNHGGNG